MRIKEPTMRKVMNRGLTPVQFWTGGAHQQIRYGWLVERRKNATVIRLPGEDRNRVVRGRDQKHIKPMNSEAEAFKLYKRGVEA